MAEPGWYPDPEGVPGRLRYWDGEHWLEHTMDEPADPTPRSGRRRWLFIIAVLLLVIAMIATALVAIRPNQDPAGGAIRDPNPPTPSVSGWNDADPTSPPPSPSPSPTESADPAPSEATRAQPTAVCPPGDPTQPTEHTRDGRVHGGELSFAPIEQGGFAEPRPLDTFGWWYDAQGQVLLPPGASPDSDRWAALIAVGAVAIRPGVRSAAEAARSSMLCIIGSDRYTEYAGQDEVANTSIKIDGHPGRKLVVEVDLAGQDSERITVITVDVGAPGSFSILTAITPTEEPRDAAPIESAIKDLRVGR